MSKYLIEDTSLTAVANAIREKTGLEDNLIFPASFTEAIEGISSSAAFVSGSVTLAAAGAVNIEHNLNRVPQFLIMWADAVSSSAQYSLVFDVVMINVNKSQEPPNGVVGYFNRYTAVTRGSTTTQLAFSPASKYETCSNGTGDIFSSGIQAPSRDDNSHFATCMINKTHLGFWAKDSAYASLPVGTTYTWVVIG